MRTKRIKHPFLAVILAAAAMLPGCAALTADVGEKSPSEDAIIKDMHSMGMVAGESGIYRCASPVRDLGKRDDGTPENAKIFDEAKSRMRHLKDVGIHTVISFENPENDDPAAESADKAAGAKRSVTLEKAAAEAVGIVYINHPMANSGTHSLEDMTDAQVLAWVDGVAKDILERAKEGGVAFHCSAGHDRTGIVAAYMRMKYEGWPVEQAIAEMRRYGHNWPKYSNNGGVSSWHEDHLRAIAKMM